MKILFVTSSPIEVNTSAMISNIALISGFKSLGHEVTLVSFKSYSENHNNLEFLKGIKLIRLEPNQIYKALIKEDNNSHIKNKIKKIILKYARIVFHQISLFDNYKKAIDNLENIKLEETYDLMISCSDPKSSHLLGLKIFEKNKEKIKTWVQHWGDPMAVDISRKSKLPTKFVMKKEEQIMERADKLIYVSPFTSEKQKEIFPRLKGKINFVPLAYRSEKIYKPIKLKEEKVLFGYYGSANSKIRNILPLYNVFKGSKQNSLKIIGDTDLNLDNTKNIQVLNQRKTTKEIENEESKTDILIVLGNKTGTQIPGKIFYYAGTNKPILIIMERNQKELWDYLESFDRFILCENNESSIRKKVENIRKETFKYHLEPLKEFKAEEVASKIINMIN